MVNQDESQITAQRHQGKKYGLLRIETGATAEKHAKSSNSKTTILVSLCPDQPITSYKKKTCKGVVVGGLATSKSVTNCQEAIL